MAKAQKQKTEGRGRRAENGGQRMEGGGQKTENGGQRTEDRRQRMARFEMVELKALVPDPSAVRQINSKDPAFRELADSVKGGGVRIPLIVTPAGDGIYQLRAGNRRLAAAAEAGLDRVPCLIYEGLDEALAEDIATVENMYRLDLTPLELSEQVGKLLEKYGGDSRAAASIMGLAVSRLNMLANIEKGLIKDWRKAVLEDVSGFGDYTAAHLAVIARLPEDVQKNLLDDADPSWTVRELEKDVSRQFRLVAKMPWDKDDETLVEKTPSCLKCPQRTGAQPTLFYDSSEQATGDNDMCLNGECFKRKAEAYLKRRQASLRKENPRLVTITTKAADYYGDRQLQESFGRFLRPEEYADSKEGAKNAVPAMLLDGPDAGKMKYVTVKDERKARPGRPAGSGEKKTKTLAEKKERLNRKRWAMVFTELSEKLSKVKITDVKFSNVPGTVFALAACLGVEKHACLAEVKDPAELVRLCGKDDNGTLLAAGVLWDGVKGNITGALFNEAPDDEDVEFAKMLGEAFGIDVQKMFEDVAARPEFAESKSWSTTKSTKEKS